MSLEIVLIPVALAAIAAWQARGGGQEHCEVQTRWRHTGLLLTALDDLGAAGVVTAPSGASGEVVTATVDGLAVQFVRSPDGIVTAHFPLGTEVDAAVGVVGRVDTAYTRRVQDAVYHRVRARVGELGYAIASEEVDEEHTITLVVDVEHR